MDSIIGFFGHLFDLLILWLNEHPTISLILFPQETISGWLGNWGIAWYLASCILLCTNLAQAVLEFWLLRLTLFLSPRLRSVKTPKLLKKVARGAEVSYMDIGMLAMTPGCEKFSVIGLNARYSTLGIRGFLAIFIGGGIRVFFYPLVGKYIFLLPIGLFVLRVWEWQKRARIGTRIRVYNRSRRRKKKLHL